MDLSIMMYIASAVVLLFGVGLAITVILLRRVVPTNMVHIVQSSKRTSSYGRGKPAGNTYYAWPSWVPILGISITQFPESIFQVTLDNYEAYDSARLPFVVDVTAFFRVDNSETAAQRVSTFNELHQQLVSVLQGSVRRILATNNLEEIMQERGSLGQQFTDEVLLQIKEWGVQTVKTIEFMDLRDSSKGVVIANIMAKEQSRIDKESRVAVAANKQEAHLKEIDAARTVEVQKQDAEQQVGLRTAEKDKTVGIANEQAKQDVQASAKITAERNMEVKRVESIKAAEIQKDVLVIKAEQDKQVQIVNAEATKATSVTEAEGKKQSTVTIAEGELEAAKLNAKGIEAEGVAKGVAEQAILMAPINTQITLAKEIGSNEGYQQYLVTIKQVEVSRDVGMEMAKAMQSADLKIIANSGDIQKGMTNLGDMFTPAGGTNLTGMLAALAATEQGKALVDKITGVK